MRTKRNDIGRTVFFLIFAAAAVLAYYPLLSGLLSLSFENDMYSHIVLIPFVSAYFFYLKRKTILSETRYGLYAGGLLMVTAAVLFLLERLSGASLTPNDGLSLAAFSFVVLIAGLFALFYGHMALKRASFVFLFLLFIVPVPDAAGDGIIAVLQAGSAEVADILLSLTGVQFTRNGNIFGFPGLDVEVARECSGIRSSLSLFIVSIVAGRLYLQKGWKRALFALSSAPISIFKNGVRIVTLTLFGIYIDERTLHGPLHNQGGVPFFVLALALLAGVLFLIRSTELKKK